jgi:hypothetical protein
MVFAGYPATERRRDRHVFALFLGFYFFTPFIFTRPMIESLAAPWVLLCAAAAVAYFRDGSGRWLVLAVAGASVAAMMRPQAGVVLVALPIVIAMRRRWRDFAILGVAATGCFIATGLIDQAIVGGFHQSLREYFRFNLANSSSFGVAPWYRYLPLLLGLTLPPVFLSRYRGLDVRASYGPLAPIWLMLGIFLVAHSAVPHKEERFLIPALPLVLALLTPLAVHLLHAPGQRWRVGLFAVLNGAGLVLLTTSPLQRNVLQFAQWLDDNPRITSVVLAQFDVLLPTAYIAHPIVRKRGAAPLDSALAAPENCAGIIASLAATEPAVRLAESGRYRAVARFNPGLLEALVVWVNPRHNKRRGPIIAYSPINCPNG